MEIINMGLGFSNIRTPEETIDRMVLSVMFPRHRGAYTQSCYGHVCHTLRVSEALLPTDRIVLLGIEHRSGVIHSVIMRGDQFLTDACSDNAVLEGDIYFAPSTRGAEPTKMQIKGEISLQDFGVKCMNLLKKDRRAEDFSSLIKNIA